MDMKIAGTLLFQKQEQIGGLFLFTLGSSQRGKLGFR
jgi:hypothetical protein